eukprot:1157787-Pelagomonas_calceolata.AAC.5
MKLVACMHGKNNKDYFDQSLDEIKLLKFTNAYDPEDKHNIVRLYDFFYYKVRCSMVACVSGCLCDPEDQHNVIRLYDYFYCKVRGSMVALVCSSLMLLQHCSALFASRSQAEQAKQMHQAQGRDLRSWRYAFKCIKHVFFTFPATLSVRVWNLPPPQEHLFLVCELLRANLYEFQKYNRESGDAPYFTNACIQRIARQVLGSLEFLHSLGLIHSDLKPENILIKSYSRCASTK